MKRVPQGTDTGGKLRRLQRKEEEEEEIGELAISRRPMRCLSYCLRERTLAKSVITGRQLGLVMNMVVVACVSVRCVPLFSNE